MGTVANLRPSDTPRSPEREALAAAIARRADAAARPDELVAAQARAVDKSIAATRAIDDAEAALAKSKEAEPRRLADAILNDRDEASPVKALTAAVDAAEARLVDLRTARDSLEREADAARAEADWAGYAIRDAVRAVVLADPATVALLAEYERRFAAAREVAAAIAVIDESWQLSNESWLAARPPEMERLMRLIRSSVPAGLIETAGSAGSEAWAAAVERLASDADAALPVVG